MTDSQSVNFPFPSSPSEAELAPALGAAPNGDAPSALISALREQHKHIRERKEVILELPYGLWQGKLAARYHYLDERDQDRFIKRVQTIGDNPRALQEANADLLIAGCKELVARRDDGDDWGPIFEDGPVRYEKRLADALQLPLESDTARAVLHALFGPGGRAKATQAIGAHSKLYWDWLSGERSEVGEELVGESPASPS